MVDTLNATWKNDKQGFGFRMLQKMGWNEDKGLGKDESGITTNIKVKKRETGLGLGVDATVESNNSATAVASFNDVLNVLKHSYGKKKNKKVKSSSSSSSSSKKKVKSSKNESDTETDHKKISFGMKYKRMTSAKDLSTKSKEELLAIFGTVQQSSSSNSSNDSNSSSSSSSNNNSGHYLRDHHDSSTNNGDDLQQKLKQHGGHYLRDCDNIGVDQPNTDINKDKTSKKSKKRNVDNDHGNNDEFKVSKKKKNKIIQD